MAMLGLDPGRVESEIKAPFNKCSQEIQQIIQTLSTVVNNNLGQGANYAWTGADAMQFKNNWATNQAKLQEVKSILDNAVGYAVDGGMVCDIDTEEDWRRAEQLHRILLEQSTVEPPAVG